MNLISPLLSIIVTAHNKKAYLDATLKSVIKALGNTLPQCELIIIDDSSSDNTPSIIERFVARYPATRHYRVQFANIGKVRNFALSQCWGEYILMVDGDDQLLAERFTHYLQIVQHQRPDLLISKLIEVKENEPLSAQFSDVFPEVLSTEKAIESFLIHKDFQAHIGGLFIRRERLLAIPFPNFICYEDRWVFPSLLMQSPHIIYVREGFYLYFKHQTSLSTSIDNAKIRCLFLAQENMERVFPARFHQLIACHWISLYQRHWQSMVGTKELESIQQRIQQRIRAINKLSFLINRRIRLSYKRKLLQVSRLIPR